MVNNNGVNTNSNNDSRKIVTIFVLIMTLMVCTTGATYAYFALTATNNVATGTAASASLTLNVQEAALKTTNTGVMVPQKESALGTAMNSTNKCVDGNGNIVCKVYTVTVTNGSSAAVRVIGYIQFSGNGSMTSLRMRRTSAATTLGSYTTASVGNSTSNLWDLVGTTGASCTVGSASTAGTCTVESIAAGASKTYYFVVWINETGASQTDTGSWRGTITFQGENGTGITSTITS